MKNDPESCERPKQVAEILPKSSLMFEAMCLDLLDETRSGVIRVVGGA